MVSIMVVLFWGAVFTAYHIHGAIAEKKAGNQGVDNSDEGNDERFVELITEPIEEALMV